MKILKLISFLFIIFSHNSSYGNASSISVLVIDQPIDFSHSDLKAHRPEIAPCNLKTGERYEDKYITDTSVFENWSHGTHVAGIIQSHIDEDSENKVSIHSGVLFLGGDDSSDEVHSIERTKENLRQEINNIERYIRKTEPRVVNLSISESSSQLLIGAAVSEAFAEVEDISKKEAINRFVNQSNELHDFQKRLMVNMMKKFPDTLFVIAAGNDSRDLSKANKKHNFNSYDQLVRKMKRGTIKGIHTLYSQIKLPNTIIVGSVDAYKIKPADFSNYSSRHVDIMAEGDKVMSTAPGGDYIEKSGTSMAAPQVSGVAAYYLQQNPELNTTELKDKILNDASKHLRLRPYVNKGRLLKLPY